jgi:hypothetical protein
MRICKMNFALPIVLCFGFTAGFVSAGKFGLGLRSVGASGVKRSCQRGKTVLRFYPNVASVVQWEREGKKIIQNPVSILASGGVASIAKAGSDPLDLPLSPNLKFLAGSWDDFESHLNLRVSNELDFNPSILGGVYGKKMFCVYENSNHILPVSVDLDTYETKNIPILRDGGHTQVLDFNVNEAVGYYIDPDRFQRACSWKFSLMSQRWEPKLIPVPEVEECKDRRVAVLERLRTFHSDTGMIVGDCLLQAAEPFLKDGKSSHVYSFVQTCLGVSSILPPGDQFEPTSAYCISSTGSEIGGQVGTNPALWVRTSSHSRMVDGSVSLMGDPSWMLVRLSNEFGRVSYVLAGGRFVCGTISGKACVWLRSDHGYERYFLTELLDMFGMELAEKCEFKEVVWVSDDRKQLLVNGVFEGREIGYVVAFERPLI